MDVVFRSARMQRRCSSIDEMSKAWGAEMARRLARRFAELRAAENLAEMATLPQARCHQLTKNRDEQISVDLAQPYRLILEVNDDPVPRTADGGLDWTQITKVVVIEIVDTH
ncbi:MAG: type II toxin-antitoxin system RelE/ParE family toxin [Candidatus Limnocylindrales bacterium]